LSETFLHLNSVSVGEKILAKWCNGYLILVYKDKAKSSIPTTRYWSAIKLSWKKCTFL